MKILSILIIAIFLIGCQTIEDLSGAKFDETEDSMEASEEMEEKSDQMEDSEDVEESEDESDDTETYVCDIGGTDDGFPTITAECNEVEDGHECFVKYSDSDADINKWNYRIVKTQWNPSRDYEDGNCIDTTSTTERDLSESSKSVEWDSCGESEKIHYDHAIKAQEMIDSGDKGVLGGRYKYEWVVSVEDELGQESSEYRVMFYDKLGEQPESTC